MTPTCACLAEIIFVQVNKEACKGALAGTYISADRPPRTST